MSHFLKSIPNELEDKLFEEYAEIKHRFQLDDCRPSQLNGGRFAEAVLRIFQHLLGVPITPLGKDIPAPEKTSILNKTANSGVIDEHIRQKTTALTRLLLDFRNNRDVAHLGGFSANRIDASLVLSCANWMVAEFIRVYGNYSLEQAQELVDKIAVPNYPVIFEIEGEEFISRGDLLVKHEILVLLSKQKRDFAFLFSKTKDGNKSRFAKTVEAMTTDKMIALKDGYYHVLPKGIKEVHARALLKSP